MRTQDPTFDRLEHWLRQRNLCPLRMAPLAGDISPRRYFRLTYEDATSRIAAAYPPELRESYQRFEASDALLRAVGVRTPEIVLRDPQKEFMVLEDLGPETLFSLAASWPSLHPWFLRAASLLERIREIPLRSVAELNPPLDATLLRRELRQCSEVFLAPRKLLKDRGLERELEAFFDRLCEGLGAESPIPAHRDFMARNLVALKEEGTVAVLDHQDLRLAPPGYDLASLLNDSLFAPEELEAEVLKPLEGPRRLSYHRAAVQRGFKAVGTFAAFAARGHDHRLPLIPQTLAVALRHMARLPEGGDLASRLQAHLNPLLESETGIL